MNDQRPKVVSLVRVSVERQAGPDRAGIDRQRESIRRIIQQRNLDCIRSFTLVNVSGSNVRRAPEIVEILAMVESRAVQGVVVADLDRLGRTDRFEDFALFQAFQDSGATLFCGDSELRMDSSDGYISALIKGAFAGVELQTLRNRMMGGKEELRKKGYCASAAHTLPLAISYDRTARKYSYASPEIDSVKEAFRLVDECGIKNYCEISRRTGIKATSLKNILRNPIYKGIRVYDTKRGPEKYQSVNGRQTERKKVRREEAEIIRVKVFDVLPVDVERFDRVQKILSETHRRWKEIRQHKTNVIFLAGGISFCAHCGSPLYGSAHPRKNGTVLSYYRCRSNTPRHRERTGGCTFAHIRRIEIDEALLNLLRQQFSRPETVQRIIEHALEAVRDRTGAGHSSEEVEATLQKLKRRQMRLTEAFEKELIPMEAFESRMNVVRQEESAVRSWLAKATQPRKTELTRFARMIARGALAFGRIKEPTMQKRAVDQIFSKLVFRGNKIVSFSLRPQFASSHVTSLVCAP